MYLDFCFNRFFPIVMHLRVFLFCLRKFLFRLRVFCNFIADVHPNLHIYSKNEVPEDVAQFLLKLLSTKDNQLKNIRKSYAVKKMRIFVPDFGAHLSFLRMMSEKGIR